MMYGILVYTVITLVGALSAILLILLTSNVKASTLLAPFIVEAAAMLYYYLVDGAISQFGLIPYVVVFPFLLLGSICGSFFWKTRIQKSGVKKDEE